MLNKPLNEQQIIELLKVHYGLDIQETHGVLGGADKNAFAYKANGAFNSYFVKIKYGDHDEINLSIIRLLHDAGINEIIFPIPTCEDKLYQQVNDFKVIVYPFIHAPNGFTANLTKNQWILLGKALRTIHETSVPNSIYQHLRKENYSTKWREIVRTLFSKVELAASDDKIAADFKAFFKQKVSIIKYLVNSAEKLSKKIQPDSSNYVLCHSDIHAGNVLITDNESIYIIDWDEPMMAPKERDLMFIGGGVGNVWNISQEISYFYEGYGTININKTILSYYRHERIVEDIALYGLDLLVCEQTEPDRREMFEHLKAMFEANGVIQIALAT